MGRGRDRGVRQQGHRRHRREVKATDGQGIDEGRDHQVDGLGRVSGCKDGGDGQRRSNHQ